MITVRKAALADMETLLRLDRELFAFDGQFDPTLNPAWTSSSEGEDYFRERIGGAGGMAWVVECDGAVGGYLSAVIEEADECRTVRRVAELESMYVRESLRGQGAGHALIREFFSWAARSNVQRLRVVASAGNQKAIAFYRREGFADFDLVLERDL